LKRTLFFSRELLERQSYYYNDFYSNRENQKNYEIIIYISAFRPEKFLSQTITELDLSNSYFCSPFTILPFNYDYNTNRAFYFSLNFNVKGKCAPDNAVKFKPKYHVFSYPACYVRNTEIVRLDPLPFQVTFFPTENDFSVFKSQIVKILQNNDNNCVSVCPDKNNEYAVPAKWFYRITMTGMSMYKHNLLFKWLNDVGAIESIIAKRLNVDCVTHFILKVNYF